MVFKRAVALSLSHVSVCVFVLISLLVQSAHTHMGDYQILFDVHELLHSGGPVVQHNSSPVSPVRDARAEAGRNSAACYVAYVCVHVVCVCE